MSNLSASIRISPEVTRLAENVQRNLVERILPRAIGKAVPVLRSAIIDELPDGRVASGRNLKPTRDKQSEKSRKRYPYHMKDRVRVKHVSDSAGVLKIVGVDQKGSHVNFDHGNKAKTTGRVHKLWWIKNTHEKYATPQLRKQNKDIPVVVRLKVGKTVSSIVEQSIIASVRAGELV